MSIMPVQIADEMPDSWVRSVVDAIESCGHSVADAHELSLIHI